LITTDFPIWAASRANSAMRVPPGTLKDRF
jgi:hypothetical protein